MTLANASDRLEALEQQRLSHFQATIGRYQRRMVQVGPAVTQVSRQCLYNIYYFLFVYIENKILCRALRSQKHCRRPTRYIFEICQCLYKTKK